MTDPKQLLLAELNEKVEAHRLRASVAHSAMHILFWAALLASVGAGVTSLLEAVPRSVVAVVAWIPAATVIVARTYPFDARSSWHFEYSVELAKLKRELEIDADAEPSLVKNRFEALIDRFSAQYPGLDFGLIERGRGS